MMGGGDRHTFEAVMFVIVRVVVCDGQWTGGCVTCRLTFVQEIILCCCGIVGNVSQRAKESLGTLAQPRGRPRSPESATQLTGYARDRCLGAGADTRMVSGQRDRRGWVIEWECECE